MSEICLAPDFVLKLLDEIGRKRALTDSETDVVEAIICRGHLSRGVRTRWNPRLDAKLLVAAASKGGIARFAERNGISPMSAYKRAACLRKGKATRLAGRE